MNPDLGGVPAAERLRPADHRCVKTNDPRARSIANWHLRSTEAARTASIEPGPGVVTEGEEVSGACTARRAQIGVIHG
jgi:hypothetical protein